MKPPLLPELQQTQTNKYTYWVARLHNPRFKCFITTPFAENALHEFLLILAKTINYNVKYTNKLHHNRSIGQHIDHYDIVSNT